jgi:hypothetical protein
MMYLRENYRVFFLLPAVAIGRDTDDRVFFEIAWLCWAAGVGSLSDD